MNTKLVCTGLFALCLCGVANGQDYYASDSPSAPLQPSRAVVQPVSETSASLEHDLESFDASMAVMGGEAASDCDCCDCGILGHPFAECIWTRDRMFGNLFGAESRLVQHGIITDLELIQFYQGVTSGGSEQRDAYGGKLDYMFTFLSEQMGLWKGGTLLLHAETKFGEAIIGEAGALATPNTNMLYPLPGQNDTAITGLLYLQALNERFALVAGKINSIDFWTMFYPNVGRGVDGFMNLNSLAAGLPWFRFVQLSENGAGILAMDGQRPQGAIVVFDPRNSSTTSGLDNMFENGAAVLGLWRFFTDWNGKPGSHLFAGGYSSRTYTALDDVSVVFVPGQGLGLVPEEKTGAWSLAYYFDQVIWADPCNEARKIQLFTGASLSDGNPSFSHWNVFASLEAFGLIHGRDMDRAGVAYFYNGLSNDLRQLTGRVLPLQEVQGVELYYNYAVTPWFRLTADLQVVDNAIEANDPALILGLRAKIDL